MGANSRLADAEHVGRLHAALPLESAPSQIADKLSRGIKTIQAHTLIS